MKQTQYRLYFRYGNPDWICVGAYQTEERARIMANKPYYKTDSWSHKKIVRVITEERVILRREKKNEHQS